MAPNITSFGILVVLLCTCYSLAFNDITDFCVNKCVQHPDIQTRWHCLRICEAGLREIVRDDVIARHSMSRKRRSVDEELVPEWVVPAADVSEENQARTFIGNGKEGALSGVRGTRVRVMNIGNAPNSYETFDNNNSPLAFEKKNTRPNKPSFARIGKSFWQVPENKKRAARSFVRIDKTIPLDEQEEVFILDPVDEGKNDYVTSDKRTDSTIGSYFRIGRSSSLAGYEKQTGLVADQAYYDESELAERRKSGEKSFARVEREPGVSVPKSTDGRGRSFSSRSFVRIGKNYEENNEKLGTANVVEDKQPVSVVRFGKRDVLSAASKMTSA